MKKLPSTITRLALLFVAGTFALKLNAQTDTKQQGRSGFLLGVEGGTTGFGPVLSYTVSPMLNFSLSYGALNIGFDDVKGYKGRYDGDLNLSNLAAVIDWYPRGGHFHLSAGAVLFDHRIEVTAKPRHGRDFEVGDHSYDRSQLTSLTGKVDTGSSVAPYIGCGWTWHFGDSGFSLLTNVGIMFTHNYDTKLTATGPVATDPTFIADLHKEEDDLGDGMRVFPVAKAGFVYSF